MAEMSAKLANYVNVTFPAHMRATVAQWYGESPVRYARTKL
jgi:hypothetical protein